ncbi:MAG TPA: TonB-dependent receptor, partial [Flavobacteriales bacterium]|nr:TonB-dependent receptor [Flavobacteriales bacterium]
VRSNNEMSATYNVRGGNFDENLIYVNDIEIYRPFLVRSGQQEGLSFINPDLVSEVGFSSGGFEARYDDRMSSVLDIKYRRPRELKGTFSGGIMGFNVHVEDESKNHRFSWMVGSRYQANGYVLKSLDTKGDYRPRFGDFQTLLRYNISEEWEISWLNYLARNNYRSVPQTRETDFGTVNQALRLTVFYEGQEMNLFQTIAQGIILKKEKEKSVFKWVNSWFHNDEQENYDVLGAYQLGEVEKDPGKENFGEVAFIRGVGGFLEHARNRLISDVYNSKLLFTRRFKHATLDYGIKFQHQEFRDVLSEWNLIDSAGFSVPQNPPDQIVLNYVLKSKANLQSNLGAVFIQNKWKWQFTDTIRINDSTFNSTSSFDLSIGARANYMDINKDFNIGPRLSLQYIPSWFHLKKGKITRRNIIFRLSTGVYHQPPLYRELRNLNGNLNTKLQAQESIHAIGGADWFFTMWGRTFKYTVEGYYKYLKNIVPYEVDNVRIRYYATNNAKGYATGCDMRINGEFIEGIESWFTFSYLRTREDILDDQYTVGYNSDGEKIIPGYTLNDSVVSTQTVYPGYIPRPTDQTLAFSVYFQDQMPKLPQFKVHLNLLFSTGVPFGPPDYTRYKDTLRGPFYRRVDIGFSYHFFTEKEKLPEQSIGRKIDRAFLSFEVFNLLGVSNTISYNWIQDASGLRYAVPNYLTGRRFNLKLVVKF